jgi:transposase-like protein
MLDKKYFRCEKSAIEFVESIIWKDSKQCPHCKNNNQKKIWKVKSKTARLGLYTCGACNKQFTIRIGTIFESSRLPLYKWLQAIYLFTSSKKGISAHQIHRTLDITYKTAWFMLHRIREACDESSIFETLGGQTKEIEADETYIGTRYKKDPQSRGFAHKNTVLSLVERKGNIRSFHITSANVDTIKPIIKANVNLESDFYTDEALQYKNIGKDFAKHESVVHSIKEYVRGRCYTNTLEGYFSVFKRGMKGIYQHCKTNHLFRYLNEFDFRYNHRKESDLERFESVIFSTTGKRLEYKQSICC